MSNQIDTSAIKEGILKTNSDSQTSVNIRSGPSLQNSVIRKGERGNVVTVLEQSKPTGDTYTWYKIRFGAGENDIGWVREDVIDVTYKNPSDASTRLRFATQNKTVRIYEDGKEVYINVYDNKAEKTELLKVPVARVPKLDTDNKWQSYIALQENLSYYVRFIPFGEVVLAIAQQNDGRVTTQEKGFQASGSEYRGA